MLGVPLVENNKHFVVVVFWLWVFGFLVPWFVVAWCLGFWVPWFIGFKVYWLLGFKVYWFLGCVLLGFLVSKFLGLLASKFQSFLVWKIHNPLMFVKDSCTILPHFNFIFVGRY